MQHKFRFSVSSSFKGYTSKEDELYLLHLLVELTNAYIFILFLATKYFHDSITIILKSSFANKCLYLARYLCKNKLANNPSAPGACKGCHAYLKLTNFIGLMSLSNRPHHRIK